MHNVADVSKLVQSSVNYTFIAWCYYTTFQAPWGIHLPNPTWQLSSIIPLPAIKEANTAIRATVEEQGVNKWKRGPCLKLSNKIRAQIGKYTCRRGASMTGRLFTKAIGRSKLWVQFMFAWSRHARENLTRIERLCAFLLRSEAVCCLWGGTRLKGIVSPESHPRFLWDSKYCYHFSCCQRHHSEDQQDFAGRVWWSCSAV